MAKLPKLSPDFKSLAEPDPDRPPCLICHRDLAAADCKLGPALDELVLDVPFPTGPATIRLVLCADCWLHLAVAYHQMLDRLEGGRRRRK